MNELNAYLAGAEFEYRRERATRPVRRHRWASESRRSRKRNRVVGDGTD